MSEVEMWIDGSCARNRKICAWGAVIRQSDGRLDRAAGLLKDNAGPTGSEILALLEALSLIDDHLTVIVFSDCKALVDALEGNIPEVKTEGWDELLGVISRRSGIVKAKWRKRKSSRGMIAAHHLASTARVLGEMANKSNKFLLADSMDMNAKAFQI